MLESNTDRFVGVLASFMFLPLIILILWFGLGGHTNDDDTSSTLTTELVATSETIEEETKEFEAEELVPDEIVSKAEQEEFNKKADEVLNTIENLMLNALEGLGKLAVIVVSVCGALFVLYTVGEFVINRFADEIALLSISFLLFKRKAPKHTKDFILFLYKNKKQLPNVLCEPYDEVLADVKEKHPSLEYASMAFVEADFINALSKLKIILETEDYYEKFADSFENPTDILRQTIYNPLEYALNDYKVRKENFEHIVDSTKHNDLNTLLMQDFNNITEYKNSDVPDVYSSLNNDLDAATKINSSEQ